MCSLGAIMKSLISTSIISIILTVRFVHSSDSFSAIYASDQRSQLIYGSFVNTSSNSAIPSIVDCSVISHPSVIKEILASVEGNDTFPVQLVDGNTFDSLVSTCKEIKLPPLIRPLVKLFSIPLDPSDLLIAPGTKYCGPGNRSTDYNDLGINFVTDACCRDHDYCPLSMAAYETKFNLTNDQAYTSSHCECDEALKTCLKEASKVDLGASLFGIIYFNILKSQCFREVIPKGECLQYSGIPFSTRCIKYAQSDSTEPVYQFQDSGLFI